MTVMGYRGILIVDNALEKRACTRLNVCTITITSAVMQTLCGWGVKAGWLIPPVDKRLGGMPG